MRYNVNSVVYGSHRSLWEFDNPIDQFFVHLLKQQQRKQMVLEIPVLVSTPAVILGPQSDHKRAAFAKLYNGVKFHTTVGEM